MPNPVLSKATEPQSRPKTADRSLEGMSAQGLASPYAAILGLQRAAGNRAVTQWLRSSVGHLASQGDGTPGLAVQDAQPVQVAQNAPTSIQTKPRDGEAGTQPAQGTEPEAAGPPGVLIVDEGAEALQPGQMRKSEFLAQLRGAVCQAAEEALAGTIWSAMGCPYIDRWFSYYAEQDSQHVERALRKYAPETASARTAQDYIPIVTGRVRRGVAEWARTGEVSGVPSELAAAMPAEMGLAGGILSGIGSAISGVVGGLGSLVSGIGSLLFKGREGGASEVGDPRAVQAQLSAGHSLDSHLRVQMESAFGADFGGVRIHTDSKAAALSDRLNARAFTVGEDIAFGAGEYQPGNPIGEGLIAHELAHVVQQRGARSAAPMQKGGAEYTALEEDADTTAVGALVSLWTGTRGTLADIGQNAGPRLRSGLRLQGCKTPAPKQAGETLDVDAMWTAEGLMKIFFSKGDQHVVETIIREGYTIIRFETAYDTWKYDDGREVEVEITGLRGNTNRQKKEIRIRAGLTNQEAATALFHEVGHVTSNVKDYLEQEIAVRIETEKFLIKHGWPPFEPNYRNPDGTVNEQAIRDDIMGSSHYNPIGRHRIRRRYEGEKKVEGWRLP